MGDKRVKKKPRTPEINVNMKLSRGLASQNMRKALILEIFWKESLHNNLEYIINWLFIATYNLCNFSFQMIAALKI